MSNLLEPVHQHHRRGRHGGERGDTAPTNDQWNLVAIELLSDD